MRQLALGLDWRGIYQDHSLRATYDIAPGQVSTLSEDLDTDYYGVYAAWGGNYTPFLFSRLWNRWGLQSSFQLRGGVYYADTDYDGRYTLSGAAANLDRTTRLSLSDDDVAFIGGLSLETRKRIGPRATLSLRSEYEYYSYVPQIRYNDNDVTGGAPRPGPTVGTRIDDDDAFSARTMLRLNIVLGPREIAESYK